MQEQGHTMPPLFAREVMHFKCREENPLKQKIRAAGQMPAQKQRVRSFWMIRILINDPRYSARDASKEPTNPFPERIYRFL